MRRRIKHRDVAVLAREPIQDFHHFAADAVHNIALGRVYVFLQFVILAFQLCSKPLPLSLGLGFLFIAPGGLVGGQLLPDIVDLFVERFHFVLPRSELRLQFRRSLFAFRGRYDCLTDVKHGNLAGGCRAGSGGTLSADANRGQQAQRGCRSHTNDVS